MKCLSRLISTRFSPSRRLGLCELSAFAAAAEEEQAHRARHKPQRGDRSEHPERTDNARGSRKDLTAHQVVLASPPEPRHTRVLHIKLGELQRAHEAIGGDIQPHACPAVGPEVGLEREGGREVGEDDFAAGERIGAEEEAGKPIRPLGLGAVVL